MVGDSNSRKDGTNNVIPDLGLWTCPFRLFLREPAEVVQELDRTFAEETSRFDDERDEYKARSF